VFKDDVREWDMTAAFRPYTGRCLRLVRQFLWEIGSSNPYASENFERLKEDWHDIMS
jgi:hypothetical protein